MMLSILFTLLTILILMIVKWIFLPKLSFPILLIDLDNYVPKEEIKEKLLKLGLLYLSFVSTLLLFNPSTPQIKSEITEYKQIGGGNFEEINFEKITDSYYIFNHYVDGKGNKEIKLLKKHTIVERGDKVGIRSRECNSDKEYSILLGGYVSSGFCKGKILNIVTLTEKEGMN